MRISDYTIRNLRTFCAVVEHGGFGAAQAVIGAGASVISTHVRDLEHVLGFQLCRRGRGGFAVTRKGQEVYHEARRLLASVESCEANLDALRRVLSGNLRVGIVDSEGDNPDLPVHAAIARFLDREHEVHISLEVAAPEILAKGLQTGDIHVAIGPFHDRQPNISYQPIYSERHALYCGRDHPLFDLPAGEVTAEVLRGHVLSVRGYLRNTEFANLPDAQIGATVSNMEAQAILIRSGRFLGFLPMHFARTWVGRGEMRELRVAGLGWDSQFWLALRRQPEPSKVVQKFSKDMLAALG
ncbi:LysR family transcriptional regulator [Pontibaca methylaminivorans]|uniref:DNA-binding transcriptional regulator, LysR family n=1 Tax=Pontibaca methylaminivorans TaxID=515897 RepID=A0A1R3WC17_9RHOB|nr:LysR family transcriptional regulator [Pontibaca methylaminivorans]SIT75600.1 DNA-binding transcriptional regulator, LysR family [Pontibaca methylaminivorans]